MPPHSPAGEMGTTGSRFRSLHVLLQPMTLLYKAGSATRHAINIGVHSYWQIQRESSATRTVSRSGPILGMAIFAAPLETIMAEVQDMHFRAFLVVKAMLLRVYIIQNSDAT